MTYAGDGQRFHRLCTLKEQSVLNFEGRGYSAILNHVTLRQQMVNTFRTVCIIIKVTLFLHNGML